MSLLMALAASNSLRLVTQTFYSSTTWTAPATTTKLESLTGAGGTGTPAGSSRVYERNTLTAILQTASGTGPNSGYASWETLKNYANAAAASINSGAATYTGCAISQWTTPSITHGVYTGSYPCPTSYVSGSATATAESGNSAGAVTSSGYFALAWDVPYAATTGGSTTAFTKTFVGGTGGAASPSSHSNLTVTPGSGYPLSIASGGFVTISYLQ